MILKQKSYVLFGCIFWKENFVVSLRCGKLSPSNPAILYYIRAPPPMVEFFFSRNGLTTVLIWSPEPIWIVSSARLRLGRPRLPPDARTAQTYNEIKILRDCQSHGLGDRRVRLKVGLISLWAADRHHRVCIRLGSCLAARTSISAQTYNEILLAETLWNLRPGDCTAKS